ncbi:hypothetical protein [Saccharopolyspora tripterygii]
MATNQQHQPIDTDVLNALAGSIRTGWTELAEEHGPDEHDNCRRCGVPADWCHVRRTALDHLAAA